MPVLIVDDFNDTDGGGDFDTFANGNGRGGGRGGLLYFNGYGDGMGGFADPASGMDDAFGEGSDSGRVFEGVALCLL
ncbi:MAG: hypothetical protein IPH13_20305 [Planctomycetes bacterium]|nr:hypothetical protein [Planctomycetota bacterium]